MWAMLLVLGRAEPVWAKDSRQEVQAASAGDLHFGGPQSVGANLEKEREDRESQVETDALLKSYWDFKAAIKKDYGLDFGLDYNAMLQIASQSPGKDAAASGAVRFFGRWELVGRDSRNTGTLVYKVENRHLLGMGISPQDLGGEVGYAGLTAVPFSDMGWALTNLYWEQQLWDGRLAFVAGVVDSTDYVNTYSFVDGWSYFYNLAFATGPTIPAPNQGLGAAFSVMPTESIYLLAGLADANGDPTDPREFWSSFFENAEFFKHIELGWIASHKRRFTDNIHLTAWQADERGEAGVSSGWGLAFSFNRLLADKWEPFVRAAYADKGGALWERSVAMGLGYHLDWKNGLLAMGLSWGRPSEDTLGPGLGDQYTAEFFYRFQPLPNLTVTPDLQLLVDPALSQEDELIAIFGLRARLSF